MIYSLNLKTRRKYGLSRQRLVELYPLNRQKTETNLEPDEARHGLLAALPLADSGHAGLNPDQHRVNPADAAHPAPVDRCHHSRETCRPAGSPGIGIAAAGALDAVKGVITDSPNLPGWHNVPLRDIVSEKLSITTCLVNDASAAALGEQRFGAGEGVDELIYLMNKAKYVQDIMAEQAKDIPEVKLLMTIPGIDFYSAMTIIGEIGDITRFPNPKKLVSYAGLAPRLKESGNLSLQGRISKKGSRTLRWILISAAHSVIRCKRGNNKLREFYNHLKKRGKSKQVAAVAVAKKLLTIIYTMLINGTGYECEDKLLTMRKLGRMTARAIAMPTARGISEIDELKEKINLIGGT